jgi:hypothetical protein
VQFRLPNVVNPVELSVASVLVESDQEGNSTTYSTRQSEYTANQGGGTFDIQQCDPYIVDYYSSGFSTDCKNSHGGVTSFGPPAPVSVTNNPTCSKYYVETFPNASTLPDSQRMNGDVDLWVWSIAGGNFSIISSESEFAAAFPKVEADLKSGEQCSVEVDNHGPWGGYSIRISSVGFGGQSSGSATDPDSYEPDNDSAHAKPIQLEVIQDRTLSYSNGQADDDWLVFTTP